MSFVHVLNQKRFRDDKYHKVNLFETNGTAFDAYCLQPGQAQKIHTHDRTDKYYFVLEGVARIHIGGEEREVGPGWAALARPGVPHGVANAGQEPLVVLVFQSPKSF